LPAAVYAMPGLFRDSFDDDDDDTSKKERRGRDEEEGRRSGINIVPVASTRHQASSTLHDH
jgi:hypothetical protein